MPKSETGRTLGKTIIAGVTLLSLLPAFAAWLIGVFYAVLFAFAGGIAIALTISVLLGAGAFGFYGAVLLIVGLWRDNPKPTTVALAGTSTGIIFGILWLLLSLQQDIYTFERIFIAAPVVTASIALIVAKSGLLLPANKGLE